MGTPSSMGHILTKKTSLIHHRSELDRSFWIDSDAVLHMDLFNEFDSAQVKYGVWTGPNTTENVKKWASTRRERKGNHDEVGLSCWYKANHTFILQRRSEIFVLINGFDSSLV